MLTVPSILSRVEKDWPWHGNGPSAPRREMSISGFDENVRLRMLKSIVPRRLDGEDILTGVERNGHWQPSMLENNGVEERGGVWRDGVRARDDRGRLDRFKNVVDN